MACNPGRVGVGLIEIGGSDRWDWGRFRGLSENANQLALGCAVMGLLSLHLAEVAVQPGQRVVALVCMIGAIIVGRLTKSDPVLLVLIAASPTFTALTFGRSLMLAEVKVTLRSAMAWILALALPLIAAYVVAFAAPVDTSSEKVVLGMIRAGASADTEGTARPRVHLWNEATRRGIECGIPGLRPGLHLEIPTGIVVGRWGESSPALFHPQLNNTPNFEAHNTILGLIATAIPGWLASAVLAIHWVQAGPSDPLLCGLALYSIFHRLARHPSGLRSLFVRPRQPTPAAPSQFESRVRPCTGRGRKLRRLITGLPRLRTDRGRNQMRRMPSR
jgi:hypothetical protein